jgi:uncharacterized protein YukE
VNRIPPEWEHTQPEHFDRVIEQIHAAASRTCEVYDQLVRTGRRKLGVPGTG